MLNVQTDDWQLSTYEIEGSPIYIIDNFYKDPTSVYEYSINPLPEYWKQSPSGYNSEKYEDRRRRERVVDLIPIYNQLSSICRQSPEFNDVYCTNVTKFIDREYNNFDNKYWWPHRDIGYNGIVYFNDCTGTNLYAQDSLNPMLPEYMCPWVFKKDWNCIHTVQSKHNRCVLFDGKKFPHSMEVVDDRNFKDYRVNQVYFFNGIEI
mgnify:CR=1 FL=1